MRGVGLLLLLGVLAGCATPAPDTAATSTLEPGSITAHMNGRIVVMGGVRSAR